MTDAQAALFSTLQTELAAGTAYTWGGSAYLGLAPGSVEPPFVIYDEASGGELNARADVQDAEFVLMVKCLGYTYTDAITGKAELSTLLNDKGRYDATSGTLSAGTEWAILTTTQEGNLHLIETLEGRNQLIFHAGFQLRVRMEQK